jgi:PilZ domain
MVEEYMPGPEDRRFTRIPFETEVKVCWGDTVVTSTRVRDISLGGIFVLTDGPLPIGLQCVVTIELKGPATLLKIQVEGEVIRVEEDGAGLTFTKIDADSLVHLRHLMKILSEDPQTIDQEYFYELLRVQQGHEPPK